MFEDQADVFRKLDYAGVLVGKIQVSAAVAADFEQLAAEDRAGAYAQLQAFNEPRYLHQTVVRSPDGTEVFYEDLSAALAAQEARGSWRVHFHVPIYLRNFGLLRTSQDDIAAALAAARRYSQVSHFEVETYAWGVLPPELKQPTLAAGIAEEMRWFAQHYGE
jgi:hypothetical protein